MTDTHEYVAEDHVVHADYCEACRKIPWEQMFRELYEDYSTTRAIREPARSSVCTVLPSQVSVTSTTCPLCRLVYDRFCEYHETDQGDTIGVDYSVHLRSGKSTGLS